jgi:cell wall-associated NlpC family hydrolase
MLAALVVAPSSAPAEESLGAKIKDLFATPTPTPHKRRKSSAKASTPTPSPTETPSPKPSASPKPKNSPGSSESPTATPKRKPGRKGSEEDSPPPAASVSPTETQTPKPSASAKHKSTSNEDGDVSPSPTATPKSAKSKRKKSSPTPSPTATATPNETPEPTASPSPSATEHPPGSPTPPATETPAEKKKGGPATVAPDKIAEYDKYSPAVRKIVDLALNLTTRNLEYKYGSADPANGGMDCSGFVYYVLTQNGVKDVPRDSSQQYVWIRKSGSFQAVVSQKDDSFELDALKPGDVMFWTGTYKIDRDPPITHAMIYLGREKGTNKRIMVGASDGRTYNGESRYGVSVFDFKVARRAPTEEGRATPTFVGYGRVPGLPNE